MRKIFTLFAAFAVSAAAYAGNVIYTADLNTEEGFQEWTIVDVGEDNKTWVYDISGDEGLRVYYQYHPTKTADDWMISPAITPTADGPMIVRYGFKGGYYIESAEVYLAEGAEADITKMTTLLGSYPELKDQKYSYYTIIDAVAGQPFRVGIRAVSAPDRWRLYFTSFSIETIEPMPDLRVDKIISPVTGENLNQETVKVQISNTGIADATSFNVSFAVNGETKATETVNQLLKVGESTEYTFEAKADLSTPRELYTVSATVSADNDLDPDNNSAETVVRHKAPATVPYFTGFEPEEYLDECKSFNLNEDDADWEIGVDLGWFNMARSGLGFLGYNYSKENNADDWFILEPINVEPGYYALKFWYSGDDDHPEKFAVYYGNACDPTAMTTKVVEYAPFARGAYEESINIIKFDQAQAVYFGFYAFSDKDQNWISIDDLSFERVESTDVDVAAISLTNPTEFLPIKASHKVDFTVKNHGITSQSTAITIKIDDVSRAPITVDLAAQQERTLAFDGLLADLAPGEHTLEITIDCEGDKNTDNNTISKTFRILGEPDIAYDFEDGKVPANFEFEVEDEGTLDPSAVEEFGENGWGIVEIGEHEYFGTRMFAGSSWINGTDEIYRTCILPKIKVNSEDACFVWNAGSISQYFYESYSVRARYEDPTWGIDSDGLAYITLEGTTRQNRGVSLGDYVGKEIQIEFNLTYSPGDALTLDNLQFFGCSFASAGVESAKAGSDAKIAVRGDIIRVSEKAAITVTDMSGRVVASVQGTSLNVGNLASGVYIVNARTANGVATTKIAR